MNDTETITDAPALPVDAKDFCRATRSLRRSLRTHRALMVIGANGDGEVDVIHFGLEKLSPRVIAALRLALEDVRVDAEQAAA